MKRKIIRIEIIFGLIYLLVNIIPYINEDSRNTASADMTLQKGDIVFGDFTWLAQQLGAITLSGYSNDHVLIYDCDNYFWESSHYFDNCNQWRGVQRTHIRIVKLVLDVDTWTVARITGTYTNTQRDNMITFCQNQKIEDYQWAYPNNPDPDHAYQSCFVNPCINELPIVTHVLLRFRYSAWNTRNIPYPDHWHCAELVWAAWMHGANKDLDPSPWIEQGFPGTPESSLRNYIITAPQLRTGCMIWGKIYDYQSGLQE